MEATYYIQGRNDGIKRTIQRVPRLTQYECDDDYEPVELELFSGQWVRQIVATRRIRRRRPQ